MVLTVLLSSGAVTASSAQTGHWTRLDDGPRRFQARFDDIIFATPDSGWVVSTAGDIYRTTNGGADWEHLVDRDLPGIGQRALRSVGFFNGTHGFVGGLNFGSLLFETHDGGLTWADVTSRLPDPVPEGICGISIVGRSHIFAVGRFNGPAIFAKSEDGGLTWITRSLSPLAETLIDVHFFDQNNGIAVGGSSRNLGSGNRAVVLLTSDGGETWRRTHITGGPRSEWGWKISFPSRFVGYVSVEYGGQVDGTQAKVLKTTDGGFSWSELSIPGSTERNGLQGIGFVTDSVGWAGGRGTTSATRMGGDAWEQFSAIDGRVNRFRFVGDSLGFAIGEYIYRYVGASASGLEFPRADQFVRIESVYPQPTTGAVTIRFRREVGLSSTVEVYDATGRRVARLGTIEGGAGTYEIVWRTAGNGAAGVAPGVYFARIQTGGTVVQSPVVVVSGR